MKRKICPIMNINSSSGEAWINCLGELCEMWRLDKDKWRCPDCNSIHNPKTGSPDGKYTCLVCFTELVKHTMGYCGIAGKH